MANKTAIECFDLTINPVTGCHNDCKTIDLKPYCYAADIYKAHHRLTSFSDLQYHPERLIDSIPGDNKVIFLNSMSEVSYWGYESWADDCYKRVQEFILRHPQHTFVMLTKNYDYPDHHYRMYHLEPRICPNLYIGLTITRNSDFMKLYKGFEHTLLAGYNVELDRCNLFINIEPMLEKFSDENIELLKRTLPTWLIIGALTRIPYPADKHMQWDWIKPIIANAQANKTPVFMKNTLKTLALSSGIDLIQEYPAGWKGVV